MKTLPRIFCITLKETPLRTSGFLELTKQAGIIDVTMFNGILGSRLGVSAKLPDDIEYKNKTVFMNDAAIGCCLSHFMLWNTLKHMPEDEFLIFEDDAIIPADFISRFEKLYDSLPPDWEFAYVGWVPYGTDAKPAVIAEGISIRIPSATHAYLIKKSTLETLCSGLLPIQSPLDLTIIKRCLPKLKYYVFDPPLVTQRSYANTKDPVWMSLIYDWQSDLYGFKRKILHKLDLLEGWYPMERNQKSAWRWSHSKFTIQLPEGIDKLVLTFISPVKNTISLFYNDAQIDFPAVIGENKIQLEPLGAVLLKGKIDEPFIPEIHEPNNTDNRSLGICLQSINMEYGSVNIPIDITEL